MAAAWRKPLAVAAGAAVLLYGVARLRKLLARERVAARWLREFDSDEVVEGDHTREAYTEQCVVHRRRRQTKQFIFRVAEYVKCRMGGTPADTPVNRAAIAKLAVEYMRDLSGGDHRASHIARDLPMVVTLVLCRSVWELDAEEVGQAWSVQRRKQGHLADFYDALFTCGAFVRGGIRTLRRFAAPGVND
jgi:hypothetical protein